uniref:Mevalonate kinase n=1 Tax=Leptinotarsa decemlineata TaxID=7539 RepID=A0A0H4IUW0_LEPDE|nr:mevalonate kinase [Leptinotarsa decemlineata]
MSNNISSLTNLPPTIKKIGLSITVSSPGKVILHGEHSVVYGKLALAASLGLRTRLTISEIDNPDSVIVKCFSLDITKTFSLQAIKEHLLEPALCLTSPNEEFSWENPDIIHHESLLKRIENFLIYNGMSDFNTNQLIALQSLLYLVSGILSSVDIELPSILLEVNSELNIGAGTGSSASYLVSVSAAFIQYVKLKRKSGNISKTGYKPSFLDNASSNFSKKELDMICNWAYCAEKIVHGTPSGLDNSICTYGSIVEFRKGLPAKPLGINCLFKLLLINTKVPRETKVIVSNVAKLRDKYPDLVNNILNAMDDLAFNALQTIKALSELEASGDKIQDHQAINIKQCYEQLGEPFSMNHNLLSALGTPHIKLDEAVTILNQQGLHGKLTGAGGGGYAIALIPPGFDEIALDRAIKALVYNGFGVISTELGGEGVRVESIS